MAHVLVNGISAKGGGGQSVLRNLVTTLGAVPSCHQYTVIVPQSVDYADLADDHVSVVPNAASAGMAQLFRFQLRELPTLILAGEYDLLLNLSDIPVPTKVPQIFLFDWAYAAFPDSPAWGMGSWRDRMIRRTKLFLFRRNIAHVDRLLVQTDAIGEALTRLHPLARISLLPNAVSLDHMGQGEAHDFGLTEGRFHLLCLSGYYSHKNLEILLPVARQLRDHGSMARILLTIDPSQGAGAQQLLAEVRSSGLGDMILNLGTVPMAHLPSLFRQSDALLLPTLLESFSGTYVEAMFHERPILTSYLPFATGVCGRAARYFDPLDATSIVDAIAAVMGDAALRQAMVTEGHRRLAAMPDWPRNARTLVDMIDSLVGSSTQTVTADHSPAASRSRKSA